VISGTTVAVASNGAASFTVSLSQGGSYALLASAPGLVSGTSSSFSVAAFGALARLGWAVQPSNATTGAAITPSIQVALQDAVGNTVTNQSASITLAIGTNPGGATLGGTLTVITGNGVSVFSNLTLDKTGGGYTLTASATGLATVTSSTFSVTSAGSVVAYLGNGQPGLVGYAVNVRPAVRVTDAGAAPLSGLTVTFAVASGGGSVTGATATTNSSGIAQVGGWTLGTSPGVNTLTATVTGSGISGSPVTFSATGQAAAYTIQFQNIGPALSPAVQAAMNAAVAKWQSIIYGALSTTNVSAAAGTCGNSSPALNQTVTGLLILVKFDSIDGPGKILGQAGPCYIRTSNSLSVLGQMTFDTADAATMVSNGTLGTVVLHEMGHVIGFGTLWSQSPISCVQLPSGPPGTISDTYFSCAKARAAFDSMGGSSYTGAGLTPPAGNKVPVENCGTSPYVYPTCSAGTVNSHWRELVFGTELMTGYVSSGASPLSLLSAAAQEDLGYTVNYAGADAYSQAFSARAAGRGLVVQMGDDVYRGPLYAVDEAGRIVRVIRS
jgi:hypothetical protein